VSFLITAVLKTKRLLDAYLKNNNIDLNKKEDLEKLLEFLAKSITITMPATPGIVNYIIEL